MIAADTSAWIDYARGDPSTGARRLELCLENGTLVLPTPVLFEILSGPGLTKQPRSLILQLPRLDVLAGFWERAASLRRDLLRRSRRARSMDCLIAQNCIDHGVALIAGDYDFRHFVRHGLRLA